MVPVNLDLNSVISLSSNLMSCDIDNDRVVLDAVSGQYYNLNETAKRICSLLDQPQIVSDLINKVAAMHDVSFEECKKDMLIFLGDLLNSNIIKLHN
jgi:hypothetical protein